MAGQEGDEREAKKKVVAGQEGDQSAAEKMMNMGGQEGDIERDEWWLDWLIWDRHDPPSLINMMGSHGSTNSYDHQDNMPYLPPINNEAMMGGQEPGDIESEEWLHWLNWDRHIDPPSSLNMTSIIPPINNEAMATVRYWNAVENEEKYRNAIKKEAVAPVKYWNAWQMSMHGSSWTQPAHAGDEGNASSYKFKKLYDLGATTTYDMPIKRKRTSWPLLAGSSSSNQAREQTRKRSRSLLLPQSADRSSFGGEYREIAPRDREEIIRSRFNIRLFAEEMLNLYHMQLRNSSTTSSLGEGKSNRGGNTDRTR